MQECRSRYINKIVIVKELLKDSTDSQTRRYSYQQGGVARCQV
jgi:hypothetical protein